MNVVIADKIQNSRELISSYLEKMEDINILGSFDDFKFEFADLTQIDLIIFDINSSNAEEILNTIEKLKAKKPTVEFIATSYEINSNLVAKTMKNGLVKDFLLKPIIPGIIEASIEKIKNTKANTKTNAKTICFFSSKAGVGKTSSAINIAYEIANKTKEKVCLLDLSLNNEDMATFLNLKPKCNIDYILSKIETSNKELFLSIINKYKNMSLYILPFKEELHLTNKLTPQLITKIINSLKNIFDWLIIDTTSLIDENNLAILNNSDLILLTYLMNLSSIRNCQKCLELFDKIGYNNDKIKLLINRYIENSEISLDDIKKTTGKDIFHKIPNNYLTLVDAFNQGEVIGETNPQSNIAKAYSNIANEIINIDYLNLEESNKINYNHGVFNLLRRMGE